MALPCVPIAIANKIKGKIDADAFANLNTGERKKILKDIFSEANNAGKVKSLTNAELDELVFKFNRGFEERIVTSSKDLQTAINKQKDIIADPNSSKAAVSRAKTTLADLTGSQEKLLKRQKQLLKNYLERELNRIPKPAQKQTFQKVEEMNFLLDPKDKQLFLEDLVAQKFGFGVTEEMRETLFKLSKESAEAQTALRRSYDDISMRAKEIFYKRPDISERVKEAEKIPDGAGKKELLDQIELEASHLTDQVFDGVLDINGRPLSKVEARKIQSERIRQGIKTQRLIDFISAADRYTEQIKFSDIKAADGFIQKYPLALEMLGSNFLELTGSLKGIVASIDVSLLLRQGWHVLLTNPKTWQKGIGASLQESFDLAWAGSRKTRDGLESKGLLNEFKGLDLTNTHHLEVRAEIATRANALNGKYQASANGYMLDVLKEETFPVSLPTKIPVAGRAFAASEHFFNAQSLRWRANLADDFIRQAELKGVDVFDRKIADELGLVVGAMTGRGLPFGARFMEGNAEPFQKVMNYTFFSPRFVGSRFYTYRAIPDFLLDPTNYAKKVGARYAAQAVLTDAAFMVMIHTITKAIWGENSGVDFKPDSPTFGHLKGENFAFDLTGGHQSFVTLAGKIGNLREGIRYDSKLGIYVPERFGESAVSALIDFYVNKTSPAGTAIKDIVNNYSFGGEELSATDFMYSLLVPLTIQSPIEAWQTSNWSDALLIGMGEAVGVTSKDLRIRPNSEEWAALREVDSAAYNQAVIEFNRILFPEIQRLRKDKDFQKLPREEQDKEIKKVSNRINKATIGKYSE
jgi:hypothetical protein